MTDQTIIIILSVLGGLLVISGIVLLCLESNWKQIVLNGSEKIRQLNTLNNSIPFHMGIQEQYIYCTSVKSKAQLDRYNIDKHIMEYMIINNLTWKTILSQITENRKTLILYNEQVQAIKDASTQSDYGGVPENVYKRKEEKIFNKLIITPRTDTLLAYKVTYTSPKGQNHYEQTWPLRADYLMHALASANLAVQHHESKQYQRTMLTNSMRYDVLKRDGFRCQICGRSVKDDPYLKLHVDHIIPVSKGGKSIMSNLRTLCDDCNLGKKDKYDPTGVN